MFLSIIVLFTFIPFSQAQPGSTTVIASDITGSPAVNLTAYDNPWHNAFTSNGDSFQIMAVGGDVPTNGGIPFALVDDTLAGFPTDELGIVDASSDVAPFFGVVDTVNNESSDPVQATWTFDTTGATNLTLNIDIAAMGDFEADDFFEWSYSLDGNLPVVAFTAVADEATSQNYTMADGDIVQLNDPLTINSTMLNDEFTTFSLSIPGTASSFTLLFSAQTNGTEAFAFRNIEITGIADNPPPPPANNVVINEFDYDQVGTDAAEFVEIYNAGDTVINLSNYSLQFVNGNGVSVYDTIQLTGTLAGGEYYVVCANAATVANCDLDDSPDTNFIQNGAPDAIALLNGPVIVDTVSYEGDVPGYTEGTGIISGENNGDDPNLSLNRLPDGTDTDNNDADFSLCLPTPGVANNCGDGSAPQLVINEFDYDQPGTDAGEFVEIYNAGDGVADLSSYSLQFVNGNGVSVYDTIQLTGTLASGDYYVVCANAATVANCDLDDSPDTNFIQNGAPDAIALLDAAVIVDTVSYEGDVPGYTEGTGIISGENNDDDPNLSLNRLPDGTDTDNNDADFSLCPPTPGVANDCDDDPPPPAEVVKIHEIQGSGSSVAITSPVIVEAIVIGDYQEDDQLDGFFIQEEDADVDANVATSEGIFVYCGSNNCGSFPALTVGDEVRVSGVPNDFQDMSQITAASIEVLSTGNALPSATVITLPIVAPDVDAFYEQFEGMLVSFSNTLVVSEYFEMARYGQVVLYGDSRPYQFTDNNAPDVAGNAAHIDTLARNRVILDDDDNIQNSPLPDGVLYHPQPGGFAIGAQGTNYFRGGDTVSSLTGVLHWSWPGFGNNTWRIRPVPAYPVSFTPVNIRPAIPANTGSNITVASVNVLNYFTSIDGGDCSANPANQCRGADSELEFDLQTAKTVAALAAMNADVFGLVEIENNGTAVATLVNSLNATAGAGTYDYIDTGLVGTDAITVAIIYKPAVVSPVGVTAIFDEAAFTDPLNTGTPRNRPAIAQSFEVTNISNPDNGAVFTVVVNHLKSKGSGGCDGADCDQNDGAGAYNATRTAAASYLVNQLATDPTGVGDADYLIIGDLNAYANEPPITTIEAAGYGDLLEIATGGTGYSYVFDGQLGYLDYALANSSLLSQVTGATAWHVNADEVPVFDYNDNIHDSGEQSFEEEPSGNPLFEANAFRNSDHDPIIVGLDLDAPVPTGSLEITKLVNWNGATVNPAQTFEICISGAANSCDTVDFDGGIITFDNLTPGDYIVSETNPGAEWTVDINLSPVTVLAGQTAQVTVTNTHDAPPAVGSLEITKLVNWNGATVNPAQTFEICISGAVNSCDTVDFDGGIITFDNLTPGDYIVSETDPGTEWTVDINLSPVTVLAGQTAQVTVTNTHDAPPAVGSLDVTKIVNWNGVTPDPLASFEICVYDAGANLIGCANHANGDVATYSGLSVGSYTVVETDPGTEWTVAGGGAYDVVADTTTSVTVTNTHDAPPPPDSCDIVSYQLWNADNDTMIGVLANGDTIDLAVSGDVNFNIVAVTNPPIVGSVAFTLSGTNGYVSNENTAPYALFGDNNGDYSGQYLAVGAYTLAVQAYTETYNDGDLCASDSISFTVIDGTPPPPPPAGIDVTGFLLVDADTDTIIGPLTDGMVLDADVLGTRNLNIIAEAAGAGSVVFSGSFPRNENAAPFTVAGDSGTDFWHVTIANGSYTVTATAYSEANGNGTPGTPATINFSMIGS